MAFERNQPINMSYSSSRNRLPVKIVTHTGDTGQPARYLANSSPSWHLPQFKTCRVPKNWGILSYFCQPVRLLGFEYTRWQGLHRRSADNSTALYLISPAPSWLCLFEYSKWKIRFAFHSFKNYWAWHPRKIHFGILACRHEIFPES